MSRKPKKGYFVKGQFVAEGSEMDLALKVELKGTDALSRTDLKRESDEAQALGQAMLTLRTSFLDKLVKQNDFPEKLMDALAEAKRISNFEGKRRQMQFIGKLMRQLSPEQHASARAALEEQRAPSAQETLVLHQAETWRDRLIADETAFGQWFDQQPTTDSQQLRALIRQARKDAAVQAQAPTEPGDATRHGRAYREIFQLVRALLLAQDKSTDSYPLSDVSLDDDHEYKPF